MRLFFAVVLFAVFSTVINSFPLNNTHLDIDYQEAYIENLITVFRNKSIQKILDSTNNKLLLKLPKCLNVECKPPFCFWFETHFDGESCLQCACE